MEIIFRLFLHDFLSLKQPLVCMMLSLLFKQLFNHLEKEVFSKKPTKNGMAVYFVTVVLEKQMDKPNYISDKSIKGYYDKFVLGKENKSGEPTRELCDLIASYIGYNNFLDFELENKKFEGPKRLSLLGRIKKSKGVKRLGLAMASGALLLSGVYYNETREECWVWDPYKYKKISCDHADAILPKDIFNVEVLQKITVDKNTNFFKEGKVLVWYSKLRNGDIQYFNGRGVHPITGKELKPITPYIVSKYVK